MMRQLTRLNPRKVISKAVSLSTSQDKAYFYVYATDDGDDIKESLGALSKVCAKQSQTNITVIGEDDGDDGNSTHIITCFNFNIGDRLETLRELTKMFDQFIYVDMQRIEIMPTCYMLHPVDAVAVVIDDHYTEFSVNYEVF